LDVFQGIYIAGMEETGITDSMVLLLFYVIVLCGTDVQNEE